MPTLTVTPNPAVPGSTVDVHGSGFDPKKKFGLTTVDPTGTEVGQATNVNRPQRDGSFQVGINVPPVEGNCLIRAYQPPPGTTGSTKVAEVAITTKNVVTPPPSGNMRWGLIGNDGTHLSAEKQAGITVKMLELNWGAYQPTETTWGTSYIAQRQSELAAMRSAGFDVILGLGAHYEPSWLQAKANARYVNQYGHAFTQAGDQQVDYVFNPAMRSYQATYIARALADLGAASFAAIRVGGGHYGELGYPLVTFGADTNCYWAYNPAATGNPVPGWKPGQASSNGEAQKFIDWYLN